MGVTALHIRLLMHFSMVLVACVQQSFPHAFDRAFSIIPTRLQLFEYEAVSFSCEGFNVSTGWKVKNIKESISKCSDGPVTSGITCTIPYAFETDSGEYWCEGEGGGRSNTVTINVNAGSVILESPVLPVMEGETVTLRCRNKKFSNLTAHFYKDDLLTRTSDTGNMTIHSVSEAHEGLYKCVSGAESSPVSPLTVRGHVILESPDLPVSEGEGVTLRCKKKGTHFDLTADFYKNGHVISTSSTGDMIIKSVSKSDEGLYKCSISGARESTERRLLVKAFHRETIFSHLNYTLLCTAIAVVVTLQMLVIGLLYWKKQLVLLEVKMNDPNKDMYTADKKKKDTADASDNLSDWLEGNQSTNSQPEKELTVSSFMKTAPTDPPPTDQEQEYSTIQFF
ncbi:Fc receptor-like protein 4 [Channa argus]|uniref:Fc receptor-like protein 4 n=1 Tax=Channa argus TaxID=215402 RepID=UPI003521C7F0